MIIGMHALICGRHAERVRDFLDRVLAVALPGGEYIGAYEPHHPSPLQPKA